MNEKARLKRNEYMKKWRTRNKDKVKAAQDRYWNKKAENEEEK